MIKYKEKENQFNEAQEYYLEIMKILEEHNKKKAQAI